MDNIRLYTGVLLFLCMFSLADFESIGKFVTERKIVQKYKNSEKMLGFGVLQYENGVYVVDVLDFTPAKHAGIEEMDKILAVDGEKIDTIEDFKEKIDLFHKNQALNLLVYRKSSGQDVNISIKPVILIPQD